MIISESSLLVIWKDAPNGKWAVWWYGLYVRWTWKVFQKLGLESCSDRPFFPAPRILIPGNWNCVVQFLNHHLLWESARAALLTEAFARLWKLFVRRARLYQE